jgi:protein-disulfide isomerase
VVAQAAGSDTSAPSDPRVAAADLARIKGDSTATVWLVMASDFQCPACKDWHDNAAAEIERDYVATGKVRFAYINFPLNQHLNARPAAEAAMCAAAQGKFWEVQDRLFAAQADWSALPDPVAHFRGLVAAAGVDTVAWNQCLADDVMQGLIDADRQRGEAGGVDQTPYFFIGSQAVGGAIPAARMRPMIDAAIARAGGAPR